MDATTIRIILIIVGALLVLALFLWERSRHADDFDEEDEGDQDREEGARTGSLWGWGFMKRARHADEGASSRRVGRGASHATEATELDADPEYAAESESDRFEDAEPLLIQLSVSARRDDFVGPDLLAAAASCGLRPGRMDIFHCLDEFDDHTRIYFSMANMVKPGTFPFDDMEGFSTPGLMLFAQLDGRPEDITILEEMVDTARKLANVLNGDVLDETRRPLTVAKEESIREAVLANERRWARAADL
jgi:cell division protein ZipA